MKIHGTPPFATQQSVATQPAAVAPSTSTRLQVFAGTSLFGESALAPASLAPRQVPTSVRAGAPMDLVAAVLSHAAFKNGCEAQQRLDAILERFGTANRARA